MIRAVRNDAECHWLIESDSKEELALWCRTFTRGLAEPDENKNQRGFWQTMIPPDFFSLEAFPWSKMEFSGATVEGNG